MFSKIIKSIKDAFTVESVVIEHNSELYNDMQRRLDRITRLNQESQRLHEEIMQIAQQ